MAETVPYSIGDPGGLRFDLSWFDQDPAQSSLHAFGNLKVWVGPNLIWGHVEESNACGVNWYWDELLDVLARSWRFLIFEESYPLGLLPKAPQLLRGTVKERWLGMPEEIVDAEDNSLSCFEQMHDLSRAVEGATLPMLFLLREGKLMLVATMHGVERLPFDSTLLVLETLGELIADRLKKVGGRRAQTILAAWNHRSDVPLLDRMEIASDLPKATLSAIAGGSDFEKFWEVTPGIFEPNELMAAARMIGRLLSEDDT